MTGDELKILLVLTDDPLAQEITRKIRSRFEKLNVEIRVSDDGARAASEFRIHRHSMVIAGLHLPGLDGRNLAEEVRKIDGSVTIFLLGGADAEPGLEIVQTPIVNWTEFLNRVQAAIPDDLKAKYGLYERNTLLFDKVSEYAKKYRIPALATASPIICIPTVFESQGNESVGTISSATKISKATQFVYRELSSSDRRRVLRTELCILAVLSALTGAQFFFLKDQPFDSVFSIKGVSVLITGFSFFGFFVGHAFERFFFAGDVRAEE